ncbi:AMP-dependent synthetase [Chromatiales bacterium (ex Bugula neritina AB1)]|nr:AMP-dependent synthetase [Chromatiales bacterium (ex Bugula neritina AB1)]
MIRKSLSADVEIPAVSLPEYLFTAAAGFADRTALVDGPSGRSYTYGEFEEHVRNFAANLARRGFRKGDSFAVYSPNLPEYAIAFLGVVLAGGVVTTVNPLYTEDELAKQISVASAVYLVTISVFKDKALAAAKQSGVKEVFSFDPADGTTPFAELLVPDADRPHVEIDPFRDLLVLPYSSGTTGVSKGVMLTHHNVVANICQIHGLEGYKPTAPDDVVIGVLPFFHIYGMVVIMIAALVTGSKIITMPRFDMEQFLALIEQYKVTRAALVPPIIIGLTKHPAVDLYDLSSLEYINSGAAPLGDEVSVACGKRLDCLITQGYGLTETSPVTHSNPYIPSKIKHGSAGLALPLTETRIVDVETGESLGNLERGEVLIRGPQVMQGYLNNAQATSETIDDDGWLHTGDIGYIDEDQYLYVIDRLKELIKYKGFQVAPAELEAVLLTHNSIVDAAVIPSPDEEAGEVPKAFVVLKGDVTGEQIMAFVAERVAPHKRIRRIEVCNEIPKSLSGKILRRVLVEQERASSG